MIEEIPEELAYAAAGVAQTISFKAYRVALTFHPLPSVAASALSRAVCRAR